MIITAISDTHTLHDQITKDLPGGDLIICSGDISSRGYLEEIKNFCKWFNNLPYKQKIFIAGNHDFGFQDNKEICKELVLNYDIEYLEDDLFLFQEDEFEEISYEKSIKIYGSPWQPEFYNWAFNLPRNGWELQQKWEDIPENTDILITHGPSWGHLDTISPSSTHLGCEILEQRIYELNPKIHIFGHIHGSYGYKIFNNTHYINAAVLGENYRYQNKPLTFNWDKNTNELNFI